jgi:hypothetical protein
MLLGTRLQTWSLPATCHLPPLSQDFGRVQTSLRLHCSRLSSVAECASLHVLAVMRAGRRIMWFGYGWGSRKDCMIAWDTAHDAVGFSYLLAYGQGKSNARGIILRLCTY